MPLTEQRMDKLRILLIHNYYKIPGGEDSVFDNECKLLRDRGNEVFVYSRHNNELKASDLFFTAPFSGKTYSEVRKLIRDRDIDIVHLHNDRFLISPSVYKAAFDEGVPIVQTLHNFRLLCINAMLTRDGAVCRDCLKKEGPVTGPALRHKCYRNSRLLTMLALRINKSAFRQDIFRKAYFITLTEFNKKIFSESCIDEDRIFVKPNFTFSFCGDAGESAERRDFILLGRIDPLKGIVEILEEWKKIPEENVLNIVGSGEEKFVKELKEKYPLKNVRFLGQTDHDEALKLLRNSKAMIFASRLYEGFPMTIIESFSCRTPVIGVDFGNGGDIIKKIYGCERPLMKDISELHERIMNFDNDRAQGLYDFKEENLKDYTPDGNYELLTEIYKKILSY